MNWEEFTRKASFVPFLEHGRNYDGWDCWGLVYCGYKDVLGISLPSYDDEYHNVNNLRQLYKAFSDGIVEWEPHKDTGSVAMVLRKNLPIHVGILTHQNKILHCEETIGTVQEKPESMRIENYYVPKFS